MLQASIDSMTVYGDSLGRKYYDEAKNSIYQKPPVLYKEDTLKLAEARISDYNVDSIFDVSTLTQKQHILSSAVIRAGNLANDWNYKSYTVTSNDMNIRRHVTDWHKKITLSLACIIFFFIGTSLGAIIRKGGLGMPVVISVFIFIFYYVMDNTCFKLARDGNWITWIGMWTSTAVLVPIGAFFTYKSNNDSVVLNIDVYINSIKRTIGIRDVRNLTRKEVIITDPDYREITNELKDLSANCKEYVQSQQYLKQAPNYFRLWMNDEKDEKILLINNRLESLIEEMSNTALLVLLNAINKYPVISINAHVQPFRNHWLNMAAGVILPVGLFFYFRVWLFGIRLHKDMEQIIRINEEIQIIIQTNN
jgi:lipopolysaccharide export system permease protein